MMQQSNGTAHKDTSSFVQSASGDDQAHGTIFVEFVPFGENEESMCAWKTESHYASYEDQPTAEKLSQQARDFEMKAADLAAAAEELRNKAQSHPFSEHCQGPQVELHPSDQTQTFAASCGQPQAQNACQYLACPIMFMPWQQSPSVSVMPAPQTYASIAPLQSHPGSHAVDLCVNQYATSSGAQTTVMWKNIPNNYTRDQLLSLIDLQGFAGYYDFFYSPIDFTNNALMGYAFINFVSTEDADRFYHHFEGFTDWSLRSEKVSQVTWSKPLQGLEGHIERYRNSPVMHADIPDDYRPVLFRGGVRIPFPHPTKRLRAPQLKDCRHHGD
jgi:hypothetical protein